MSKLFHMESSLARIPEEVFIEHIFQFCGNKSDILSLQLVCKKFHSICSNEYLFKRMCLGKWKESFVIHLPECIMKKYYQNSYRKMFFLDNKYRYCHYAITKDHAFSDLESIREYDQKNGTDIENQLVQGICMDLDYKNDFYSEEKFNIEEEEMILSLEKIFDEEDCEEWCVQDPYVNIFCPLLNPEDEKDSSIDQRFPKFYMVYHYPGDNISGYVYEENSKIPIMSNGDGCMAPYDYVKREHIYNKKGEEDNNNILKPLHDSFERLYTFHQEICELEEVESDDVLLKEREISFSLELFKQKNEDRLEYTNTPVFNIILSNEKKKIMICHFVDDSRKWSDQGTMGGITRNLGNQAKIEYENNNHHQLKEGDCIFTEYPKRGVVVCSCVVIKKNNTGERSFVSYQFEYQSIKKIKEYCKKENIIEIHFDMPKRGSIKYYRDLEVRKCLNKLVNKDGFRVIFHDRMFNGSNKKDLYEKFF